MRFRLIQTLKKLFQYLFCLLVCLQLVGGPSSLVQVYAWANMLASYSAESGLVQGTRDTFSGEKPCALCCKLSAIKKTQEPEKESPVVLQVDTKHLKEVIPSTALDDLKFPFAFEFPNAIFASPHLPPGMKPSGPDAPPPRAFA